MISLILSPNLYPLEYGGSEIQNRLLGKELEDRGKVYYVFISREEVFVETSWSVFIGIRQSRVRRLKRFWPIYWHRLFRIIRKISPDLVYIRNYNFFAFPIVHFKGLGAKGVYLHVASRHDLEAVRSQNLLYKIGLILLQKSYKKFDLVFVQDEFQYNIVRRFPKVKVIIVNKFVSIGLTNKRQTEDKNPFRVVWIGGIKPLKRLEVFLDMADKFGTVNDMQFIVIGPSACSVYNSSMIERMKSQANVTYHGSLTQEGVNEYLLSCHVLFHTSLYEGGIPNVFIQAWLTKTYVISLSVDSDSKLTEGGFGFMGNSNFEACFNEIKASYLQGGEDMDIMLEKTRKRAEKLYGKQNLYKLVQLMSDDIIHRQTI